MDSTLSTAASTTLFTLSKTLTSSPKPVISNLSRHFLNSPLRQTLLHKRFTSGRVSCISNGDLQRLNQLISVTSSATLLRSWYLSRGPISTSSSRLACVSNSAASFASGGGGDGFIGGGGGGGGGGDGEGELKSKSIAAGIDEVSALSPDVIILDVAGMTCGGCAASVKRILESQPQVSSASVNLATETAIIWPVPEAKATKNWQQQIGELLANHLTNCGFKSNLRGQAAMEGEIPL